MLSPAITQPHVELIFDADCPHAEAARAQVRAALAAAELVGGWTEWERSSPASPAYVRRYGSPTILINGTDVAPGPPMNGAACCRLYRDKRGRIQGVPDLRVLIDALRGVTEAGLAAQGTPP